MKRRRMFKLVFVALVILFAAGGTGITLYTDLLFFQDVGYAGVFTRVLSARFLTGLAFAAAALIFVLGNVLYANRISFARLNVVFLNQVKLPLHTEGLNATVRFLGIMAAVVIAFFSGMWGSALWKDVLVFMNRMDVAVTDPVFGKDMSFYLFQLPLFQLLKGFAGFITVATFLVVGAGYFFRGAVMPVGKGISIESRARYHLAVLGGLIILNAAAAFYLDQFGLLLSPTGVVFGAGYTDVHARLFVLRILVVITALAAIFFTVGVWRGRWKFALMPAALAVAVFVAGFLLYPVLLQNLKVSPNELDLERPFIENNIKLTRFAYDLERIEVRPFDPGYGLTEPDVARNDATIKNIRLWDDSPLLKTYSQLQQIRTYYKFHDIDNDRYVIGGDYRQVMLSPRELSYADLPSRSWINEKMVFTHGNGVAMGPVNRITREGLPEFIIKDIPPASSANIKINRPEIYFGELSSDYVIVKTKVKEFSYPTSEGNVYTSYEGSRGVLLDSLARKAAFSFRFASAKILLSSDITPQSRILYYREVRDRVTAVAPFLIYDNDPYIVISDDGKLHWIIDAYTVSNRIPYSKPWSRDVNYIRNSVKVTVDAYDGSINFYVSDPADVIARVYGKVFPGLFKDLSEMPADLKKHIRYPQELFQIQASMFAVYHMKDPKTFYNKEDLWEIPAYGDRPMEPYYTIMKLPEEKETKGGNEEYILLQPFTPAKRDNLAAWLAARSDGQNYGNLVVYSFPRDRLVFGPRQVGARIDQDAQISQQLTLWGQKGSRVIRGRLLVIPIENSLLYVQPLYLVASDEGGLPELRRVIVAYENDVVMEENLETGLARLFAQRRGVAAKGKPAVESAADIPLNQLAKEAVRLFERATELQRKGDWTGYGEHLKKLEEVLKKLAQ
jgi:hypothetical protein